MASRRFAVRTRDGHWLICTFMESGMGGRGVECRKVNWRSWNDWWLVIRETAR